MDLNGLWFGIWRSADDRLSAPLEVRVVHRGDRLSGLSFEVDADAPGGERVTLVEGDVKPSGLILCRTWRDREAKAEVVCHATLLDADRRLDGEWFEVGGDGRSGSFYLARRACARRKAEWETARAAPSSHARSRVRS